MGKITIKFDEEFCDNDKLIYTPIIENCFNEFIDIYKINYEFVKEINIKYNKNTELEDYDGIFKHHFKEIDIYELNDLERVWEIVFHELCHAKFEYELELEKNIELLRIYCINDYAILFENEFKAYYYTYKYILKTKGHVCKYYSKLVQYLNDTEESLKNKNYSKIKTINLIARKSAILKIFIENKNIYGEYLKKYIDLNTFIELSSIVEARDEKMHQEISLKILKII